MVSACVPLLECRDTELHLIFNTTPSYHHTQGGNSEKEETYESAPVVDEPVHSYADPEPVHSYAEPESEPAHSYAEPEPSHDIPSGDHGSEYAPEVNLNLNHSLDAPYQAPQVEVPTKPVSYDSELDQEHIPYKP